MRRQCRNSDRGYSLVELLIALTLGLLVLGTAVQLFSRAMDATWIVSQRAELQQDARAASNLLTKDLSLAGAGIPTGGVGLVSGGAVLRPRFGCDYTGKCYLGPLNANGVPYPQQVVSAKTLNYSFGVIPGWKSGITINAGAGATDTVTIIYADTAFLLADYHVMANDSNGNSITFTLPAPAPNPLDQAVNNPGVGLQQGDLVLFTTTAGGAAIAEVTAPLGAGAGPYTVAFATGSSLLFNQNGGTSGNIQNAILGGAALAPGNVGKDLTNTMGAIASRIWVITYYLDNTNCTPQCLMRQVNARLPVPVAENVADLRLTYDTYDDNGNLLNATGDGGMSAVPAISPGMIRRINLAHLTFRSQLPGQRGYQSMDMQTSISARNMSFIDRYK